MNMETTLEVSVTENVLDLSETVQTLEIVNSNNVLSIENVEQHVEVEGSLLAVDILNEDVHLEIASPYTNINQYFSGEGAVADQDTIVGDGTQFDPLRSPDMLRVSLRLGEFTTAAEKQEAITNLGLHVIDGGTFTY